MKKVSMCGPGHDDQGLDLLGDEGGLGIVKVEFWGKKGSPDWEEGGS